MSNFTNPQSLTGKNVLEFRQIVITNVLIIFKIGLKFAQNNIDGQNFFFEIN